MACNSTTQPKPAVWDCILGAKVPLHEGKRSHPTPGPRSQANTRRCISEGKGTSKDSDIRVNFWFLSLVLDPQNSYVRSLLTKESPPYILLLPALWISPVMVSVLCWCNLVPGCPDTWLNIMSCYFCEVFTEEIRLNKADYPLAMWVGLILSDEGPKNKKEEGRTALFCLCFSWGISLLPSDGILYPPVLGPSGLD